MDDKEIFRKERKKKEKIWAFIAFFVCLFLIAGLIGGGFFAVKTYLLKDGNNGSEITSEDREDESEEQVNTEDTEGTDAAETETEATDVSQSEETTAVTDDELAAKVESTLNEMTLEEKVGQMFMVQLSKLNNDASTQAVTDTVLAGLDSYHVGGVVILKENISDKDQLTDTIGKLQENRTIPLFIAAAEESGDASVLSGDNGIGLTAFANQSEIGDSGDNSKANEYGATVGKEMSEIGFNVNFAPVADISVSNNTTLGSRSYGTDASVVAGMVKEAVTGMQQNSVSAVLKYFPGSGSATGDASTGASTLNRTLEQLKSTELLPYQAGIEAGADFIMVGHMAIPEITGNTIPGSLSSKVVTDLLRDTLGFKGVVITDELNKKAISDRFNAAEAAKRAVNAGADVLLMPSSLKSAYEAVLAAVKSGEISEDRINESVTRILEVKLK